MAGLAAAVNVDPSQIQLVDAWILKATFSGSPPSNAVQVFADFFGVDASQVAVQAVPVSALRRLLQSSGFEVSVTQSTLDQLNAAESQLGDASAVQQVAPGAAVTGTTPALETSANITLTNQQVIDRQFVEIVRYITAANLESQLEAAGMAQDTVVTMIQEPRFEFRPSNVPPPPPPAPPSTGSSGPPGWVWAIVAVGIVALVVAVAATGFVVYKKRRRAAAAASMDRGTGAGPAAAAGAAPSVAWTNPTQAVESSQPSTPGYHMPYDPYASTIPETVSALSTRDAAAASAAAATASYLTSTQGASSGQYDDGGEESDGDFPLGSAEPPPGAAPLVGLPIVQVFESDRQKAEGSGEGTIMTRIITERTSSLTPGAPFLEKYRMVDGMRTTNTSVIRYAVRTSDGLGVGVKFYSKMEDFNRERELHSLPLDSRYVPEMLEFMEGSEELPPFIVTLRGDFSLAELLERGRPTVEQQRSILYDLACGIAHLHANEVVHMDVCPANLSYYANEQIWKLEEFENWAKAGEPASINYVLRYTAPEVVSADVMGDASVPADRSMDLFSLGVIAFELLTNSRFYPSSLSNQEVMQQLLGYKLLPSEGNDSVLALVSDAAAQRLLRHLIRRNPGVRWDADKVVNCAYFRSIRSGSR